MLSSRKLEPFGGRSGNAPERPPQRTGFVSLLLLGFLLSSCERAEEVEAGQLPGKTERTEQMTMGGDQPRELKKLVRAEPGTKEHEDLVTVIYELPADELLDLVELIGEEEPARRTELLALVYEETRLRPEFVRLPLILELARAEDCQPGLRTTILAELGSALNTDHGKSWGDWNLALEEHLESEGLIREDR
jgi:hypothetical protein